MKTTTLSPLSQAVATFFNEPFTAYAHTSHDAVHQPRVDVIQAKNFARLEFELPGIQRENINIEVQDKVLIVSAERAKAELKEDEQFYLRECRKGKFERQFRLGEHLDTEKVDAQFENGVLIVTVGKREESLPKKIEIK